MKQQNVIFFVLPTVIIALLGFIIQTKLLLTGDVGYLIHAANLLLSGEQYGGAIFETNPPLILYLYWPVCFLTKYTSLNVTVAVRCYVFLLGLVSLLLSFSLLQKIIQKDRLWVRCSLFLMLPTIYFILPVSAFAQREHLLVLLIIPYLLASALALQGPRLHPLLACTVGVMAGLGFALKPFFLVTPCLIEFYLLCSNRPRSTFLRVEALSCAAVIILYFCTILIISPQYIDLVLPYVFHYYFPFAKQHWQDFFSPPYVTFCCAMIFCYGYFYRFDHYRNLGAPLWLGLVGLTAAFCMERTSWYYHVLPAVSLAYLLVAHIGGQIVQFSKMQKIHYGIALVAGSIILSVPLYNYYLMLQYGSASRKDHYKQQIMRYINFSPGDHSMVCLPIGTMDCFPFVYLIHGRYASRFPSLWWYKGVRATEGRPSSERQALQVADDKQFLIAKLADDFTKNATHWVIVNQAIFKDHDLIAYLNANQTFRAMWHGHYHAVMTAGPYQLYERNGAGAKHEFH